MLKEGNSVLDYKLLQDDETGRGLKEVKEEEEVKETVKGALQIVVPTQEHSKAHRQKSDATSQSSISRDPTPLGVPDFRSVFT